MYQIIGQFHGFCDDGLDVRQHRVHPRQVHLDGDVPREKRVHPAAELVRHRDGGQPMQAGVPGDEEQVFLQPEAVASTAERVPFALVQHLENGINANDGEVERQQHGVLLGAQFYAQPHLVADEHMRAINRGLAAYLGESARFYQK
jgi:hypothetical protein